ncbi:12237_t:CDS:2 [Acaulospora colombiana]|uniref:12237_t:CDS:1 n=1 Tax=Acaulospora colombiana TaxID=27376 RepID=A0ACA9KCN3_9GLOM|nr:12237_t:CDS:2 [Acaulospora colombiana]
MEQHTTTIVREKHRQDVDDEEENMSTEGVTIPAKKDEQSLVLNLYEKQKAQ